MALSASRSAIFGSSLPDIFAREIPGLPEYNITLRLRPLTAERRWRTRLWRDPALSEVTLRSPHYFDLMSIAIRIGSGRMGKLFEWNGKMARVAVREDAGGHDLHAGAVERVEYVLPKQ